MEVMIAILLFGIFLINSLFGLNLVGRIDKLIEIKKKERMADEERDMERYSRFPKLSSF